MRNECYILLTCYILTGIGITNGEAWREHRRFAISTLRDFGMGKSKLEGKIQSQATVLAEEIESHDGRPFDPQCIISTHVANVICSMTFGKKFKHTDKMFVSILKMFEKCNRYVLRNVYRFWHIYIGNN